MKREERKEKKGKKKACCLLMKRSLLVLLFSFFSLHSSFGVPLEELVPGYAAQLRQSSDPIIETQLRNPSLRLIPADNNLRFTVNSLLNSLGPSVLVETLFLYKKPAEAHTSNEIWDNTQKIGIFNQLTAISSLEGIQYFSESRGVMRTFFITSHIIDNPNNRNRRSDTVYNTLPGSLSLYVRQEDLTFGDNIYQYNYTVTNNYISFIMENVSGLSYGIIPVIGRTNYKTVLVIYDCGDSLLIYAVSMAKAVNLPGIGDRVSNSFKNRVEAVISWFSRRMDIYFEK